MIDIIYKTLLTIINKEIQGYVSPTEFNLLANNVQNEIFRGYFSDYNRDVNRENRGLTNGGYANLSFNQRQLIQQFAEPSIDTLVVSGVCDLPEDVYFIEDNGVVTSSDQTFAGVVVDEVEIGKIAYLNRSLAKPTGLYPVYERLATSLRVSPNTITKLDINYLRKPKQPNWTFTVITDPISGKKIEMFNPASPSFQDFELHESEFTNIMLKMLSYFGLNIREQEVVEVAEVMKDKMNVKENN